MARKKPEPRTPQLELAGALCVAFVNTAGARDKNSQQGVKSYGELVTWGQQAGLLSTHEAECLRRVAAERPEEAQAVYSRASGLRFALARIFLATFREQRELDDEDLAAVNNAVAAALPFLRLVRQEAGVTVGWSGADDALDRMLWPVAYSALEILVKIADRPLRPPMWRQGLPPLLLRPDRFTQAAMVLRRLRQPRPGTRLLPPKGPRPADPQSGGSSDRRS